ncbi:alpha-L-rhamnosidase [Microbacterium xanthum]|uniref:alpha-L-rhamnosidase n=1 Tax=Microbacterium xanthum TaxID=3079794 RepID=UPI002AD31181|nr:family 78 glycoside hydrolase catalytic domain [Microbacterium sp. KSW-48]MDZ8171205.1 family 78 glycoside hydrolase catalytic domain [Microbacterium sp. KSW-48]
MTAADREAAGQVDSATFITTGTAVRGAPRFRHQFVLDQRRKDVASATLSLSALGIYEAWINGQPVGQDVLAPGWTAYEHRVHLREYDVTHLLAQTSVIGLLIGNGWYHGRLGWKPTHTYGEAVAAYARLNIVFRDGTTQIVGTSDAWRASGSEVIRDDLYDGQTIDARLREPSWLEADHDLTDWQTARLLSDAPALVRDPAPPVRRVEEVRAVSSWKDGTGKTLVDFGQNLVGWVRLSARGRDGDVVRVRHAEVLENGALSTRPLRSALATDEFILSGGNDHFEPTMTFHGFRYVEIENLPDEHELSAVVVSSNLRRTGYFECSDADLNRLHQNIVWGARGNFVDIPTDCPQRDERMGWTGDIAVFAPTAAYLYDVRTFLEDWLVDLVLEQADAGGVVPLVVPDILKRTVSPADRLPYGNPVALWSDAAVWVPWALWEAYGELVTLEASFDSMAAHCRQVERRLSADGVWDTGFQFGDWLDPDAPSDRPGAAKADARVVATACAFRSASLTARAAELLGRPTAEFVALAARLRQGFRERFVRGGRIESDCATVYALAIVFDLVDGKLRDAAGERLEELVREAGYRISTGFAGTPFVLSALTDTGHVDAAVRLISQRECPSWLYPVTMGATTVWERWDSMLPDGSVNPGAMTSFNHYALGAVADWMHRRIAGLAPLDPGYRRMLVEPVFPEGMLWARGSLETPAGLAQVGWERVGTDVRLAVTVPRGTSAVVRVAGFEQLQLSEGNHVFTVGSAGIQLGTHV